MNKKRDVEFDIAKGILIFCVVVGHGGMGSIADLVYRFHMPLFFIISGYFIQKHDDMKGYAKRQFMKLMIPYFLYMALDFIFFNHSHNLNRVLHYLWGGRFINGVYWYITCYLISSVIFVMLLKYFSSRKILLLLTIGGGIALLESQLIPMIPLLRKPGIPFDADVALLSLGYLSIGYYGRTIIDKWRKSESLKVRTASIGIGIILIIEFVIIGGRTLDMKQVLYSNLIYNYFVPIGYGLLLLRLCRFIDTRLKYIKVTLQVIGQLTIPIMYLHEPVNRWLKITQDNIFMYMIIGIGVPILLGMIMQKYRWGKYLGIYPIQSEGMVRTA